MKNKILFALICLLALGAGAVMLFAVGSKETKETKETRETRETKVTPSAENTERKPSVPAYQTASEARNLPSTLPPKEFFGKTREAYLVAKTIPQTLAQLPCYCHCDQGFGHKSLHTCFVDDHAAHCAVCVDEALLAFQLQREEKLTPEQVREKIIEKYGAGHNH